MSTRHSSFALFAALFLSLTTGCALDAVDMDGTVTQEDSLTPSLPGPGENGAQPMPASAEPPAVALGGDYLQPVDEPMLADNGNDARVVDDGAAVLPPAPNTVRALEQGAIAAQGASARAVEPMLAAPGNTVQALENSDQVWTGSQQQQPASADTAQDTHWDSIPMIPKLGIGGRCSEDLQCETGFCDLGMCDDAH